MRIRVAIPVVLLGLLAVALISACGVGRPGNDAVDTSDVVDAVDDVVDVADVPDVREDRGAEDTAAEDAAVEDAAADDAEQEDAPADEGAVGDAEPEDASIEDIAPDVEPDADDVADSDAEGAGEVGPDAETDPGADEADDSDVDTSPDLSSISHLRNPATRPADGTSVRIEGVLVTALQTVRTVGFYVQDVAAADYSGLFIYTGGTTPPVATDGTAIQPGMLVDVEGQFTNFSGIDEIRYPTSIAVVDTGVPFCSRPRLIGAACPGSVGVDVLRWAPPVRDV